MNPLKTEHSKYKYTIYINVPHLIPSIYILSIKLDSLYSSSSGTSNRRSFPLDIAVGKLSFEFINLILLNVVCH